MFLCALLMVVYGMLRPEHWVVYYNNALSPESFQTFDLIVFDSDSHPPLAPLQDKKKTLLAYMSLGEVNSSRSYFKELQDKQFFIKENKQWGSWVVDVRRPEWTAYVNDTLIPAVLAQGFNGIMIDTVDSVTALEDGDPVTYVGMKQAAVHMIKDIHRRYPNLKIMINRGFDILPEVGGDVDMVLAESVYTDIPAGAKVPVVVADATYRDYIALLRGARKQFPKLKVYTLDYWLPSDTHGVKRIYKAERRQGFIPYVSTNDLQNVYPEP